VRKLLVASAGALIGACGGDPVVFTSVPPGEWVAIESASLTFHTRPNDPLFCGGYVAELERYVTAVRAAFPGSRVGTERVTVYQFSSREDLEQHSLCERVAGLRGCAFGSIAYTTNEATEHEIAHALFYPLGIPPPLFGEGIAVAVSCQANPEPHLAFSPRDFRSYLHDDSRSGWAPRFVTYLIDAHGTEKFLELYASLPYSSDAADVEREFRRVYDAEVDDVWAAMTGDAVARSCMALQACDGAELDSKTEVLGRGCEHRIGAPLPNGAVEVAVSGSGWGLRSCSEFGYSVEAVFYEQSSFLFWSGNNRHAVLDYRAGYDASRPPIEVSARPLSGVLVESCDETRPIELSSGEVFDERALIGPSERPLYLEFHADAPYHLYASPWGVVSDATLVDVCQGCSNGQETDCEWVPGARAGRRFLRVRANELLPGDFLEVSVHAQVE
jgi:hypothetical protein